jgi:cycloeucalenol cycloisomerase
MSRRTAQTQVVERTARPEVSSYVKDNQLSSLWFSSYPQKRHGETLFLYWSIVWIGMLAIIVASRIFERFTATSYTIVGLLIGVPPFLLPFFFTGDEGRVPWWNRYTTKANVWIAIFSFIGNYFWTHYFYQILSVKYTFPAHRFNDVPITCYLLTHSYFLLYHTMSSLLLRRVWHFFHNKMTFVSFLCVALLIGIMSYATAFTEVFTIQNFPYYSYPDRYAMWAYGSIFYALYFVVSYPMFLRLDERDNWSFSKTIIDAFAAGMMVTQLLDFWRLLIGPIHAAGATQGLPFVH